MPSHRPKADRWGCMGTWCWRCCWRLWCMELGKWDWVGIHVIHYMLLIYQELEWGIVIGKSLSFFFIFIFQSRGGILGQIIRLVVWTEENWQIKRTLIFPIWILCFKKYEIVMIQVSGPGPYSLNSSRKGRTKMAREKCGHQRLALAYFSICPLCAWIGWLGFGSEYTEDQSSVDFCSVNTYKNCSSETLSLQTKWHIDSTRWRVIVV